MVLFVFVALLPGKSKVVVMGREVLLVASLQSVRDLNKCNKVPLGRKKFWVIEAVSYYHAIFISRSKIMVRQEDDGKHIMGAV